MNSLNKAASMNQSGEFEKRLIEEHNQHLNNNKETESG